MCCNVQTERALALELAQFPDVINATIELLMPSKLCNYVYVLSGKATDFLEACHVLTNPHRLVLVQGAISVMHKCLELLAITPLQRI
jgi:arginyl-tRNA synthetase